MMSANSASEALWQVLHQAGALLTDGGFADPLPARPAHVAERSKRVPEPAEGYSDLAARYTGHLPSGAAWPLGTGTGAPRALILTQAPLSEQAWEFVRTWFENPKVDLNLTQDFFIQPLPDLEGGSPSYQGLARDLCALLNPKALLSLGPIPAQRLLGAPLSIDTLRGSDYRFDRWSMVTTLDPEEYLGLDEAGKGRFKAQVWRDLQRLLGKLKYG